MSVEEFLSLLVGVLVVVVIIVAANYADREGSKRINRVLAGVMLLINVLIVTVYGLVPVVTSYSSTSTGVTPPSKQAAWTALVASIALAGLVSAWMVHAVRSRLAVLFPRYQGTSQPTYHGTGTTGQETFFTRGLLPRPDEAPLFPQMLNYYTSDSMVVPLTVERSVSEAPRSPKPNVRGFNPDSAVHTVALALCTYLLGIQMINFLLEGGLSGVAESYQGNLTILDLIINILPFLIVAFLGVGLGLRRTTAEVLQRLGVGKVDWRGAGAAVVATFALFFFVAIVSAVWMGVVSEATYKEQTQASDALAQSVTSVAVAFVLALTAAVGEEIAYRGALQPVFGLWPTAIIFALTHAQYSFTPAWLIILGVALVFGWLRQRFNTTVSMLAHFLYNFIPLALSVSVAEGGAIWLLKLLS